MYKSNLKKKINGNKTANRKFIFSFVLCIMTAFVFGNLFGISTKSLENPKVISFFTICGIEFISFLKYSKYFKIMAIPWLRFAQHKSSISWHAKQCLTRILENNYSLFYLNSLKRGFLIGLFIEAFKVGS